MEDREMWLPGPLYEALPYLYAIVGVLFISGALYLGAGTPEAPFYIAIGALTILGGLTVFQRRQAYRQNRSTSQSAEFT